MGNKDMITATMMVPQLVAKTVETNTGGYPSFIFKSARPTAIITAPLLGRESMQQRK